jgi:hypothetical protein
MMSTSNFIRWFGGLSCSCVEVVMSIYNFIRWFSGLSCSYVEVVRTSIIVRHIEICKMIFILTK